MTKAYLLILAAAPVLLAASALAQDAPEFQISDNSVILEEAYNQDPGVVQHILTAERARGGGWEAVFTEEWPAPGLTDQLSFSIPWALPDGGERGIGDVSLNWRRQLVGGEGASTWVASRVSIYLPTGDWEDGNGSGGFGVEGGLALSTRPSERWALHANAFAIETFGAQTGGEKENRFGMSFAASACWLVSPAVNLALETKWAGEESGIGAARTWDDELTIAPAIRFAWNLGDAQIVPGIAFPIGVGPSRSDRSVVFYLSYEAPMWRPKGE